MEAASKAQNHCEGRCDGILIIDNKDGGLLRLVHDRSSAPA
jgi:hypothetical protein